MLTPLRKMKSSLDKCGNINDFYTFHEDVGHDLNTCIDFCEQI